MAISSLIQNFTGVHADLEVPRASQAELVEQLKSGSVPLSLQEEWKLIDENSELGIEFQAYMTDIIRSLLRDAGEIEQANNLNIRFLLTAEEQANAGIVNVANPPIMMISKGFWKTVLTRDHVEGVAGHELGHAHIYDQIGEHNNSKGEETSADLHGTDLLFKAKRNTEALKEFLVLLHKDKEDLPASWVNYVDPHPSNNLRIRILENKYEALNENQGGYTTVSTSLPSDIKAKFSEFEFKTAFQTILEQAGYVEMPINKKVAWLAEQAPRVKEWRANGFSSRANELCTLIQETAVQVGKATNYFYRGASLPREEWPIYEAAKAPLMRAALATADGDTYQRAAMWLSDADPLQALVSHVETFINSKTPEDAQQAAKNITTITSTLDLRDGSILKSLQEKRMAHYKLPDEDEIKNAERAIADEFSERSASMSDTMQLFNEVTEKHGVKLPWHHHVGFYLASESPEILEALRLLGVKDLRFPKLPEDPSVKEPPTVSGRGARWTSKEEEAYPVISLPAGRQGLRESHYTQYISYASYSPNGLVTGTSHEDQSKQDKFVLEDRYDPQIDEFVQIYDRDALIAHEKLRLAKEDQKQFEELQGTDFSEMRLDFWGFVKKHRQVLTPDQGVLDAAQPFQARFLDELKQLIASNPSQYKASSYEFFSGRDSKTGERILYGDETRMALERPTTEQKKILGEVLGKTLALSLEKGVPVTDAILQVTKDYQGTEYGHYLETSKRALRTVFGDYLNAEFSNENGQTERLVTNTDIQDIFSAILQDGRVDPQILFPAAREVTLQRAASTEDTPKAKAALDCAAAAMTMIVDLASDRFSRRASKESSVAIRDSKEHIRRMHRDRNYGVSLYKQFAMTAQNFASRIVTKIAARRMQSDLQNRQPSQMAL